ncbi:MAG: AI-2E family transporter [Patescibacteria group bacterium]|nr:AI-2E family transporter [Patescibacteria group bacterium]
MELNKHPVNISITSATIFKTIAILVLLYFMYLVSDILVLFFVALVFASALDPWVDWLKKRKIPRSLSVLFLYFVVFSALALSLYLVIPLLMKEVNDMSNNFPRYFESIYSKYSYLKDFSSRYGVLDKFQESMGFVSGYLSSTASGIFFTLTNIFGGIVSFVLVLVLTFYMVVEESAMKKLIWSIAPERHQPYIMQLVNRIQIKMGYWLRGQLILGLALTVMAYIALTILGINYSLILAILVGLFSFIPYMGAILGSIPAIFIAFAQAPLLAVFTVVLFYIIHFVEGNFLYPKVMEKAVGLNPVISILAMLAGLKLAGIIGAILSIPVATAIAVFIKDIFDNKEAGKKAMEEEG